MPTPTGLPRPGETWRLTMRLPDKDGQWETIVHTFKVIERGSGSYWPLRVKNLKNGEVHLMVDASYHFSHGMLKFVPDTIDADKAWEAWHLEEFGVPAKDNAMAAGYRSAWEHGRMFGEKKH